MFFGNLNLENVGKFEFISCIVSIFESLDLLGKKEELVTTLSWFLKKASVPLAC